jgi:hypothetical protein
LKRLAESVKTKTGRVVIVEFVSAGKLHGEEEAFVSDGGHAHTDFPKGRLEKDLEKAGLEIAEDTEYYTITAFETEVDVQVVIAKRG